MDHTFRKCVKCGWTGSDPKWALCPFCGNTYYRCPDCGKKTEPVKPVYKNVLAREKMTHNFGERRNQTDNDLTSYFIDKFKELDIEPITLDSSRKKRRKTLQS